MTSRDGRSSAASSHSGGVSGGDCNAGSSTSVPSTQTTTQLTNKHPNRSSLRTPKRPRSAATACSSAATSIDDKNQDYLCTVCKSLMEAAHITKCGHTFCYGCIINSIDTLQKCPICSTTIVNKDTIIPNFSLNDLITKHKSKLNDLEALGLARDSSGEFVTTVDGLRDFVSSESANLSLPDVNVILEVLTHRKQLLEAESCAAQNKLLLEFLKHLQKNKFEQREVLLRELNIIEKDIDEVEVKLRDVKIKCPDLDLERSSGSFDKDVEPMDNIGSTMNNEHHKVSKKDADDEAASSTDTPNKSGIQSSLATLRRRMHAHFDDFVQCYFSTRFNDLYFAAEHSDCKGHCKTQPKSALADTTSGLDEFCEDLVKFSRYSALQSIATLNYSSDLFNNSTIVSSIAFDKDNEFFAIAGVTKRIKVYEYGAMTRDAVDIHYPCMELLCSSKISCVCWNSYHKGTLASSDYEGIVTVWDANTGQKTKVFQEHEKRCWSIDFNDVDTRLIASGSDDARVKLYSLQVEHSIATLEARANICCVKFNPKSSYHLAYGSADHCVHYYDLRNMKEAVTIFRGHKKAVSYVKFLNNETIVSASTDSQLKVWNVNRPYCLKSFTGHLNEKNFVGLATDGDYIACGSENNALYVYYKGLTKKLFSYKFESVGGVLEQDRREDEPNEFVSAVCWKQNSNVVLAANSQGTLNVLEMV